MFTNSTHALRHVVQSIDTKPLVTSRVWTVEKEMGINSRQRWKRGDHRGNGKIAQTCRRSVSSVLSVVKACSRSTSASGPNINSAVLFGVSVNI